MKVGLSSFPTLSGGAPYIHHYASRGAGDYLAQDVQRILFENDGANKSLYDSMMAGGCARFYSMARDSREARECLSLFGAARTLRGHGGMRRGFQGFPGGIFYAWDEAGFKASGVRYEVDRSLVPQAPLPPAPDLSAEGRHPEPAQETTAAPASEIPIASPTSAMSAAKNGSSGPVTSQPPMPTAASSSSLPKTAVAWVHLPKTGTTLGTILAHYANPSMPTHAFIDLNHSRTVQPELEFLNKWRGYLSEPGLLWAQSNGNWGGHNALSEADYRAFHGHFFGMFRAPRLRARSAHAYYLWGQQNVTVAQLAQRIAGACVMQLAGQRHGNECLHPRHRCRHVETADVALALRRLDGFAFVGLTDDWELSVCLFHAKFRTPCLPQVELPVQRASVYTEASDDREPSFYDEASTASTSVPLKKRKGNFETFPRRTNNCTLPSNVASVPRCASSASTSRAAARPSARSRHRAPLPRPTPSSPASVASTAPAMSPCAPGSPSRRGR